MTDTNHVWNDGPPILAEKQLCGCHITADTFELCQRGKDLKKSVDETYRLWQSQKDTEVDKAIIRALYGNFEVHRKGYLGHVTKGDEWALWK